MFNNRNYMLDDIENIRASIREALAASWHIKNFTYNKEKSCVECIIENDRKAWRLSYLYSNYPTYESFLTSLKVDVAIANLASNYEALSIAGSALSTNGLKVRNSKNKIIELPVLENCLNVETGIFNTKVYLQKLQAYGVSILTSRSADLVPEEIASPLQIPRKFF